MPQTLAQKLVARAAGRGAVDVGEFVTCRVDLAMCQDSSGPHRIKPMLDALGAEPWDRRKLVLVIDHHLHETDASSQRIVRIARDWAAELRLPHVYDGQGIGHVVVPQGGHIRPGMFCVGGDAHATTGGALGAYMFGIGATEMAGVLVSGETWLQVPQTISMRWIGRLADGVSAKDMMLAMIGRFGAGGGLVQTQAQAVEFCGEAVAALSMAERMTLCNMGTELGAQAALVAPDQVTRRWLEAAGADVDELGLNRWHSDEGAVGCGHSFDASGLAPQVALPHSPSHVRPVDDLEHTPIDIAYLGACTGAKLDDLRAAARVLAGYRIASGVQLLVAPASVRDHDAAEREGILRRLVEAGATVLPSGCGACAGHGGRIPEGATVISSTARNAKGRLGAATAQVYLGSPYTVAASALRGRIADAREVLA